MNFTPLPNLFFSHLSPQIDSLAEMKVVLHIFWLLYQKRGYPKFVTYQQLLQEKALLKGITEKAEAATEELRQALGQAVNRGILLHLTLDREGKREELYFLNTEADRRAVDKIREGKISLGVALPATKETPAQEKLNIFSLYEQNIGLLTPLIAEELKEAEKAYPPSWIEDAFKQAVSMNKRSWRYISRILERWSVEGKDDGEPGRHFKKKEDPDKYIKGKYGHLVRR